MASKNVFMLVLENDSEQRISQLLSKISTDLDDIQIQIATNAETGLTILQKTSVTLILLGLPFSGTVGDGLNLLIQLRQLKPDVPIVVLVNQEAMGLGLQALEFGAFAYYFEQHLSSSVLQRLINKAVNQHTNLQAASRLSEPDVILFNSLPACVAVLDEVGLVTAVNPEWQRLSHKTTEPLILGTRPGRNFYQLCQQIERPEIMAAVQKVLDDHQVGQGIEFSWREGARLVWWKLYVTALRWPHGGAILSIQDVTDGVANQIRLSACEVEISELKNNVISLVHELRTPLTAIRLYLNLLKSADDSKKAHYLTVLSQETVHLEQYVDDLLTLAQLEQTDEPLFKPVNFGDLVEQVVTEQRSVATAKGLTLSLDKSQDALIVQGQSRLLSRIITNLVANAVRYTITGGVNVLVSRDETAGRVVLRVADSGIGIAPEVLPHIFEPFFRSPRAQSLIQRGSGLGLDIVKRILTMHGGNIEVTSEINKGSVFFVFLPAYQEPFEG